MCGPAANRLGSRPSASSLHSLEALERVSHELDRKEDDGGDHDAGNRERLDDRKLVHKG